MLSQDLRTLHVWWVEAMYGRAEFTGEGALKFERMLAQAVEDADAIEQATVAASDQAAPPPRGEAVGAGNVVPFPAGRTGKPNSNRPGGSAA